MIVRKCEVVKIEAIVRGYITGSAWVEYKKSQTVHGISMPAGLVESQKLPKPMFTPSTKAEQGEHDQNIHPDQGERRHLNMFWIQKGLTVQLQSKRYVVPN